MIEEVSLYFHIPFCKKKCPYCHFYVIPDRPLFKKIYTEAIALEWERQLPLLQDKRIVSLYFGGGTPSLLAPEGITFLLDLVKRTCTLSADCEITIEANPEDASYDLFALLHNLGINRLSLGVQSLDDRSLTLLERGHGAKRAKTAVFEAFNAGIQNISIDLMYDLPDQTEASWNYTLDQIGSLPIAHLSLYNLTIEPHTSFFKRQKTLTLPDPTTSLNLLKQAIVKLESFGLNRYEISAFAKEGKKSHHNTGYWTARPFLGFGPSAFSYWKGERFRNVANLQRYARALRQGASPVDFSEKLSFPANLKELLAIHLRLLDGIDLQNFPLLPSETIATLEKWITEGALIRENRRIHLTEKGTYLYDSIATDLI